MNLRPSGSWPDELPGCSNPQNNVCKAKVRLLLAFANYGLTIFNLQQFAKIENNGLVAVFNLNAYTLN